MTANFPTVKYKQIHLNVSRSAIENDCKMKSYIENEFHLWRLPKIGIFKTIYIQYKYFYHILENKYTIITVEQRDNRKQSR